jgi:hypothetical protein
MHQLPSGNESALVSTFVRLRFAIGGEESLFGLEEREALILESSSSLSSTALTDLSNMRTFEDPASMMVIDTPESVFNSILGQNNNKQRIVSGYASVGSNKKQVF